MNLSEKNVFHFLCISAHGQIQTNSISEYTMIIAHVICALHADQVKWPDQMKINSNSKKWNIVLIWAY